MPTILLVDDEPNIRWTMAELLKRAGYETITCSDFDSAVSILDANSFDAAVIDIVLPRKSGIDILKEFRKRESYIPVIMITGEPNISQIPELVRAGAYDFISKPVVKDVLLRAVANALEKKRLVDEKRKLEEEVRNHAERLGELVTERTRELAEAHSFLNTVLDSSTEYAILAIDTQGRVTLFNRGAELMFGCAAARVMGKEAKQLVRDEKYGPDEKPFLKCGQEAAAAGHYQVEMRLGRAGGSTFVASVAMTPIRKSDQQLIGYLAVIRDMTTELQNEESLRRMRERLAQNEKIASLGRMAAQVAHEVRNPLAGLRLYSLHLKGKVVDKLSASEMALIDKIIGGINHLSDTVEQVLTFARPITLTRRRADLNKLVADAIQLLEPQLSSSKIETKLDLIESGALAMLDEAMMRSALLNLMLNSIQAMTEGGLLKVSTEQASGSIEARIEDTGCGMTEEQIKSVFEPFYTTKSQGLGLGMSHAYRVVEMHGGSIEVYSKVGEGTQIKITLPVEEQVG